MGKSCGAVRPGADRFSYPWFYAFLLALGFTGWNSAQGQPISGQGQTGERFRAFVVGVDRYEKLKSLTRAVADARTLSSRLRELGYEVLLIENPDKQELLKSLRSYSSSVNSSTTSLFYFAGHGLQIGGNNYLLARDSDVGSAEQVLHTGIAMTDALQVMSKPNPRHSAVIIDACRDGVDPAPGLGRSAKYLSSILAPNGFYVVFSAGSGQTAIDSLGPQDPDPNSVFMRVFLRALSDTDAPLDQLVKHTRREVARIASSVGHDQHPAIYDQTIEEIPLSPVRNVRRSAPLSTKVDVRQPGTRALSIGVADLRRQDKDFLLKGPLSDARAVSQAFREIGIEQISDSLLDPNIADMRAAIQWLGKSEADHVILYYAGLGVAVDGEGYLLGTDSLINSRDHLSSRAISIRQMLVSLARPGRTVTLLIDTSLSETFGPQRGGGTLALLESDSKVLERKFGAVSVLYATSLGKDAFDVFPGTSQPLNRGPFSIALENALPRKGLTISQFAVLVNDLVREMTKDGQSPTLFATLPARKLKINP